MSEATKTSPSGIPVEKLKAKLGEKEIQCLMYEQIIDQLKEQVRQLNQKLDEYKKE